LLILQDVLPLVVIGKV